MEQKKPQQAPKEKNPDQDLHHDEPSTEAVVETPCADARMMLLRHPEELPKSVKKKRL